MRKALYRTYRSKRLAEIVGQEHITTTLASAIKQGRISHAYLFTGPRGTGKTSIARIMAHEINQLPYRDDQPHLDIIEIDAASNRRIDDIRDLRDKVHIAPVSAKYKVYIIDEVHMLTGESFNALLKTLEEPPAHVVFMLATTEAHKLPATIVSRTQRYTFRPIPPTQVISHLKHIAGQEKLDVADNALALIAEHGEGSFRDSINLLDQLGAVNDGPITAEAVEQLLGLAPQHSVRQLVDAIAAYDPTKALALFEELKARGSATGSLLSQLVRLLQAEATRTPQLYTLIDALIDVPRAYNPWLKLVTSIMTFIQKNAQPTPTPSRKPVAAAATLAPPVLEIAMPQKAITAKPPTEEAPAVQRAAGVALQELTQGQWTATLTHIKKLNQPLHTVLRMARPDFDNKTQTLTLQFGFALHQKKMEDAKSKTVLAQTMASLFGAAPIIKTLVKKEPSPNPTTPPATHAAIESVTAIMGGGDIL